MVRQDAYVGRESKSTRNPHSAALPATTVNAKLSSLSPEDRVLAQWRASFGCPISDEAKAQFCIEACDHSFRLSDVRLWHEHHPDGKSGNNGTVYLEFFFDGTPAEIEGRHEEFTKAFERMLEQQLQEQRIVHFRQKLTARKRKNAIAKVDDEASVEDQGDNTGDDDWSRYLKTPVPATELSIRSMREAGCCLRFLVCQTSLSTSASEVLGQIAFHEHFPVDGVIQASTSSKPLPRWVYGLMTCTAGMTTVALVAWWQVVRQVTFGSAALLPA